MSTGTTASTITFRKNGRVNWTVTKTEVGMFTVTFATPHPLGNQYIITATSNEVAPGTTGNVVNIGPRTSTSFGTVLRDVNANRQDYSFSFIVH